MSKLNDIYETDISFPSLYSPDVIAMQIGEFGKIFLRELAVEAQAPNVTPEGYARVNHNPAIMEIRPL